MADFPRARKRLPERSLASVQNARTVTYLEQVVVIHETALQGRLLHIERKSFMRFESSAHISSADGTCMQLHQAGPLD